MTLRSLLRKVIPSIPESLDEEIDRLVAEATQESIENHGDMISRVDEDLRGLGWVTSRSTMKKAERLAAIRNALEQPYVARVREEEKRQKGTMPEPEPVRNSDDPVLEAKKTSAEKLYETAPIHINLIHPRPAKPLQRPGWLHFGAYQGRKAETIPGDLLQPGRKLKESIIQEPEYGEIAASERLRRNVSSLYFNIQRVGDGEQAMELVSERRLPHQIANIIGTSAETIIPQYVAILYFDHHYTKKKIRELLNKDAVQAGTNSKISMQEITDMIRAARAFDTAYLETLPRIEAEPEHHTLKTTAQRWTKVTKRWVQDKKRVTTLNAYCLMDVIRAEPKNHYSGARRLVRSPLVAAGLTIAIGSMIGHGLESVLAQREAPERQYAAASIQPTSYAQTTPTTIQFTPEELAHILRKEPMPQPQLPPSTYHAAATTPQPTSKSYAPTTIQFTPEELAHILRKEPVPQPTVPIEVTGEPSYKPAGRRDPFVALAKTRKAEDQVVFGLERIKETNYQLSINHQLREPVIVVEGYGEPIRIEPQMRRSGVTGAMDLADLLPEAVKEPGKRVVVKLYDGEKLVASARGSGARIFGVSPSLERALAAYQEQRALYANRDQTQTVTATPSVSTVAAPVAEENRIEEEGPAPTPVEVIHVPYYAPREAGTRIDLALRYMPSIDVTLDQNLRKHIEKFLTRLYKKNQSRKFVPIEATVFSLSDRELLGNLEGIVKTSEEWGTTPRKIGHKLQIGHKPHMDEAGLYALLDRLHPVGDPVFSGHQGITDPRIYLNLEPADAAKAKEMLGLMPDPDGNHCIAKAHPNDAALFYIYTRTDLREIYQELREKLPRAETLGNSERQELGRRYDYLRQEVESWVSQFRGAEDPGCATVPIPPSTHQPNAALEQRLQNSNYANALVQATLYYDRRRRGSAEGEMTVDEILDTVRTAYNVELSSRDLRKFVDSAEVERRGIRSTAEGREQRRAYVAAKRAGGMTTRQIAEESGWSETTVRRDYKQANA